MKFLSLFSFLFMVIFSCKGLAAGAVQEEMGTDHLAIGYCQQQGNTPEKNPPATPPPCPSARVYEKNTNPPLHRTICSDHCFTTLDSLVWRARENDFSLAFHQTKDYPAATNHGALGVGAKGQVIRFDPSWEPGFRIGFGRQASDFEGWDVYLYWTCYRSHTHENLTATTSSRWKGFVPFWGFYDALVGGVGTIYGKIQANWNLLYNMINLELGREFFVSQNLSLRPLIGMEGGWIDRYWNITYSTPGFSSYSPTPLSDRYANKSNFWGIGPKAGLNGNWRIGRGFHLFGNLGGSLLSGSVFKNSASFGRRFSDHFNYNHWRDESIFQVVPHLQAILGLGWNTSFKNNRYGLNLSTGWEVNHYWNLPMVLYPEISGPDTVNPTSFFPVFNRQNRVNDLALSGLTIDSRFDF